MSQTGAVNTDKNVCVPYDFQLILKWHGTFKANTSHFVRLILP